MRRLIEGLLFFAFAACARAGDTLATSGATLELSAPPCELSPQLFTPAWQWQRAGGGLVRSGDGSFPFALDVQGHEALRGQAVFAPAADGAVEASYTFTAVCDVALNALYVGASLPTDRWAGGAWTRDAECGTIPAENRGLTVLGGKAARLSLATADGKQRLAFLFPEPTDVVLQDDRQWGPTFSLRIGLCAARTFKKGERLSVRFTLATHEPQRLALDEPVTIQPGPDWIPLKPEPDIRAGSALDFAALRPTGAPAGRYGRVVAKGAQFEFESLPGVAQRFYGVNLCFSANYLEADEAALIAGRLARTGYNALRLHHHDGGLVEGSADGTTLNPLNLAKLDALVAACVSNGLYVTTDLYVSRPVPWRSIGVAR